MAMYNDQRNTSQSRSRNMRASMTLGMSEIEGIFFINLACYSVTILQTNY
jgi:hypothetical protein